jgi:RNA polymerase sigma factor (TIGR02999 family)
MEAPSSQVITRLLAGWSRGDRAAFDQLVPVVYDELHRIAGQRLQHERPNHTLQPTALVNEAYLKLIDQRQPHWRNRAHFFAIAATLMRRILVDHARSRAAHKRGEGLPAISLEQVDVPAPEPQMDVVALDHALERLASIDPRQSRLVELRYFGGLSIEETAEVLGISPTTISREWCSAKAWLYREMRDGDHP